MRGSLKAAKAPGAWYLIYDEPAEEGKRRQRQQTFRGTKPEAERRLRDVLRAIENGESIGSAKMTVEQLCTAWLAAAQHRVGERAHANYKGHVDHYIVPAIGTLRLRVLRPTHVERALASWVVGRRADRRKDKSVKLSARTVAHVYATLRAICRWGVRMEHLARNPVDNVDAPRIERREMVALDVAGVGALLEAVRGTELFDPVVVAIGTGLRRGELLALRWSDVDLEERRLHVRRALEFLNGKIRVKEPKTERSRRTIGLGADVIDALRRRRAAQSEQRLAIGIGKVDDWWIFTREDQSAWTPHAFGLAFRRAVRRAKIPHVRLHDLRHTWATGALAAGVDLKTVSLALGHSTITMTANVYLHAVEALKQDAADRAGALLFGNRETTVSRTAGAER